MLFSNKPRGIVEAPDFDRAACWVAFLDESSHPRAEIVRGFLNRQFENYPEHQRAAFKQRFFGGNVSEEYATLHELTVHSALLALGLTPTVGQSILGGVPDFLVSDPQGRQCIIEARVTGLPATGNEIQPPSGEVELREGRKHVMSALIEKAGKYVENKLPYVITLNVLNFPGATKNTDRLDILDVLFPEIGTVGIDDQGNYSTIAVEASENACFSPDFWNHVSAIWYIDSLGLTSVSACDTCIVVNPYASFPIPQEWFDKYFDMCDSNDTDFANRQRSSFRELLCP